MAKVTEKNGKTYIDIQKGDMTKGSRVHSAGKGDTRRPTNSKLYEENYDKIDWSK